jgi:Pyruvate/2-oxoacid:ferredoxin oxidoreductase delta subunit
MAKTDLKFGKKLKKYGAIDFNACYNCGTCTAVCDLSDKNISFPRNMVRCSVLGLSEDVKGSLKPWQCYYCGECTTYCPQEAKPGELMMSLRRYLTSVYDWTGLSGVFYRNTLAYLVGFLIIIGGVVGLFIGGKFDQKEFMHFGHLFEMFAIGGVFLFILLPNIIRMWKFSVWNQTKYFSIPAYFKALSELLIHMFTQKRTLACGTEKENKQWWIQHLILVLAYMSLLFITVVLDWFATEYLVVNLFGYAVSFLIFWITLLIVIKRVGKKSERTTFSHPSDWFFLIWLFMMGFTAFLVRLFVDLDILESNFWMYLIHIIVLVQWALIIVPFGKWTHFLYRSFAMYFVKLNELAKK